MNENVPVMAAARANWNETMPDASLSRSSPFKMLACRSGISTSFASEETATASVGPSAAPRAKAAASPIEGMNALTAKPMASVVAMTRPIASENGLAIAPEELFVGVLRLVVEQKAR